MAGDYVVGFKKPPKISQFKPGQSGNSRGRPKGTKNLKSDLLEELDEKIVIKVSGEAIKVSKQRALVKALAAKAIGGDVKAMNLIAGLVLKLFSDEPAPPEASDLTEVDMNILEDFKKQVLKQAKPAGAKKEKFDAK